MPFLLYEKTILHFLDFTLWNKDLCRQIWWAVVSVNLLHFENIVCFLLPENENYLSNSVFFPSGSSKANSWPSQSNDSQSFRQLRLPILCAHQFWWGAEGQWRKYSSHFRKWDWLTDKKHNWETFLKYLTCYDFDFLLFKPIWFPTTPLLFSLVSTGRRQQGWEADRHPPPPTALHWGDFALHSGQHPLTQTLVGAPAGTWVTPVSLATWGQKTPLTWKP